jgi:hypothetical protein
MLKTNYPVKLHIFTLIIHCRKVEENIYNSELSIIKLPLCKRQDYLLGMSFHFASFTFQKFGICKRRVGISAFSSAGKLSRTPPRTIRSQRIAKLHCCCLLTTAIKWTSWKLQSLCLHCFGIIIYIPHGTFKICFFNMTGRIILGLFKDTFHLNGLYIYDWSTTAHDEFENI